MRERPSFYRRPDKPLSVPVPQRDWRVRTIEAGAIQAPAIVHAGSECHVTPPHVAARMVDLLGHVSAVDVLEPSAGTGNIARAVLNAGCDVSRVTLVEMHTGLAASLQGLGKVECADFLEWARNAQRFDRIVMNPPFSRVCAHMTAARQLLKAGGTLVALVPVTFSDAGFEDIEMLPVDTFRTAKVRTKIVLLETTNS